MRSLRMGGRKDHKEWKVYYAEWRSVDKEEIRQTTVIVGKSFLGVKGSFVKNVIF